MAAVCRSELTEFQVLGRNGVPYVVKLQFESVELVINTQYEGQFARETKSASRRPVRTNTRNMETLWRVRNGIGLPPS
jgi:hypothetical protein